MRTPGPGPVPPRTFAPSAFQVGPERRQGETAPAATRRELEQPYAPAYIWQEHQYRRSSAHPCFRASERRDRKYFDGSVTGHVTIEPEGSGYRTDCTLHLASGVTLQAEGRAQEVYASFDQTAARIESRLRRYKRKLKDRSGAHPRDHAVTGEPIRYTVLARSTRSRRRRRNTNSSRRSSPSPTSCCKSCRCLPRCWSWT